MLGIDFEKIEALLETQTKASSEIVEELRLTRDALAALTHSLVGVRSWRMDKKDDKADGWVMDTSDPEIEFEDED